MRRYILIFAQKVQKLGYKHSPISANVVEFLDLFVQNISDAFGIIPDVDVFVTISMCFHQKLDEDGGIICENGDQVDAIKALYDFAVTMTPLVIQHQ